MGFKTSNENENTSREFLSFLDAQKVFEDIYVDMDVRLRALEYMINHNEIHYVLEILETNFTSNSIENHPFIDFAFTGFGVKPKRDEDFKKLLHMLKSDNAYLRNAVIRFLQEYGEEIKPFIESLISSNDKDLRIFAINILGDVRFDDSIDMLRYFIAKEDDTNALMTAVDYIGEIGTSNDIALLESIKLDRNDEPYVHFGIDMAIKRLKENDAE